MRRKEERSKQTTRQSNTAHRSIITLTPDLHVVIYYIVWCFHFKGKRIEIIMYHSILTILHVTFFIERHIYSIYMSTGNCTYVGSEVVLSISLWSCYILCN